MAANGRLSKRESASFVVVGAKSLYFLLFDILALRKGIFLVYLNIHTNDPNCHLFGAVLQ